MEASITVEAVPGTADLEAGSFRYTVNVVGENGWQGQGFGATEAEAKASAEHDVTQYYSEIQANAARVEPLSYKVNLSGPYDDVVIENVKPTKEK